MGGLLRFVDRSPLFVAACLVAVGCVAGMWMGAGVEWLWIAGMVVLLAVGVWKRVWLLIAAAFVCLGIVLYGLADGRVGELPRGVVKWRGVVEECVLKGERLRCSVRVLECGKGNAECWAGRSRVLVYVAARSQEGEVVREGRAVEFGGKVTLVRSLRNDGYARWLRRNDVAGVVFTDAVEGLGAADSLRLVEMLPWRERVGVRLGRWRERLLGRYDRLHLSEGERAVVGAMTLGDRSGLWNEQRMEYSVVGSSHVLALSGLHLSILTMVWLMLLRKAGRRRGVRIAVGVVLLVFIWGYVLLAGHSVSLVRSGVMVSLVALSAMVYGGYNGLNSLGLAALVLMAQDGRVVGDVGFQLSFVAVMALVVMSPLMVRAGRLPLGVSWLVKGLLMTVVAQVATAPLVGYYFGVLPAYFFVGSLWAVVLTPWVLLSAGVYLAGLTAAGPVVEMFVRLLNNSMHAMSNWPYAAVEVDIGMAEVVAAYVVIVGVGALVLRALGSSRRL